MFIEYLVIGLAAGLLYLLLGWLFSLLFPFARVYRTLGGVRTLVGYLWRKRDGQLVLHSTLIPFLSRARGRVVGGSEVRLLTLNADANYTERTAGYFQTDFVTDEFSSTVATIEPAGKRGAVASCNDTEVAYARGSIRAGNTFAGEAAAVGALVRSAVEASSLSPDERVGLRDLLLPATVLYLLLYYPLLRAIGSLADGRYPQLLLFVLAYAVIVAVLYVVKYQLHLSNRSLQWPVLFNTGVGNRTLDWITIVVSAVLLIVSTSASSPIPYWFQPALMAILLSLCAVLTLTPRRRELENPYRGWRGPWQQKPTPIPPNTQGLKTITYSWLKVLESKHITGDDKTDSFSLQLPVADYEGAQPRVRMLNPFYPNGLDSEADRDDYTRRVLAGADQALRDSGAADLYEERVLTQIVNSAYQLCVRYNLADFELYDLVLLFCQQAIDYRVDGESDPIGRIHEYYRFASETLYDREGDCDCKAVLAYRLFERLGVKPRLAVVKANGSDTYNHAALVLPRDPAARIPLPPQYREYAPGQGIYCEATADGQFHPGDLPQGLDTESIHLV